MHGEGQAARQGRHHRRATATAWASWRASSPRRTATSAESRRGRAARGPRHRRRPTTSGPMRELTGGYKLRVLLAQALFGKPDGAAARRAHQQPRPRLHPLAGGLPPRVRGRARHHLPRPPLPQRHLHAHRRHRLRDDHHLHRRLRRHGARQGQVRGRVESENAEQAEEDRPAPGLRRPLRRRHARLAGAEPQEADREAAARPTSRSSNIARPFIQFDQKRPSAASRRSRSRASTKSWRRRGLSSSLHRAREQGREDRHHRHATAWARPRWCACSRASSSRTRARSSGATRRSIGYLPQDHHGAIPQGHHRRSSWLHDFDAQRLPTRRSAGCSAGCSSRAKRRHEAHRRALRWRGGARCSSAKLMLTKDNVLVLDEPTNHLDLESISRARRRPPEATRAPSSS